jgi:hypothetical protein
MARREAVVREANSLGTFWLRTALLPEPVRGEMRVRLLARRAPLPSPMKPRQAQLQAAAALLEALGHRADVPAGLLGQREQLLVGDVVWGTVEPVFSRALEQGCARDAELAGGERKFRAAASSASRMRSAEIGVRSGSARTCRGAGSGRSCSESPRSGAWACWPPRP